MTKLNELKKLEQLTWWDIKEYGPRYYSDIFNHFIKETLDYETTWEELKILSAIKSGRTDKKALDRRLNENFSKWINRRVKNFQEKADLDKVVELMTTWITDELIWRYYEKPVLIGETSKSRKDLIETFLKSNCSLNVERRESILETIDLIDSLRFFKRLINDTDVKLQRVGFNYYGLETINNNELEIDQLI